MILALVLTVLFAVAPAQAAPPAMPRADCDCHVCPVLGCDCGCADRCDCCHGPVTEGRKWFLLPYRRHHHGSAPAPAPAPVMTGRPHGSVLVIGPRPWLWGYPAYPYYPYGP